MISERHPEKRKGSALLAVLWLAAALSAIAFTVATTVRGETERTATEVDSLKAYYLASGSVDRALLWMEWGQQFRNPDGTPRYWVPPMPRLHFEYPTGAVDVEIIPENSKLNINQAQPIQLLTLLAALNVPNDKAMGLVSAIIDWRSPSPGGAFTDFDQYYLSLSPTFRARHASFQEIEELLVLRGMTPELFHGRYEKGPDGNLLPRPGLKDCLSVYGGTGVYDVNSVEVPVMIALGLPPESAAAIAAQRRRMPFLLPQQVSAIPGAPQARIGLTMQPNPVVTLRATAATRLPDGRLSDMRRSVSAMVAFLRDQTNPSYHVMRWYDNAVSIQ